MLHAPNINPVAVQIGPLAIHWYGLMYVFAFGAIWFLSSRRVRVPGSGWTEEELADAIFYGALGVIFGGRIGYILFYNLQYYLAHPINMVKVWDGGMSFHGGLMGVIIALGFFARKTQKPLLKVTDFLTPWVPIGLGAGRIGNFINQELPGRVTTLPWGMVFRGAGPFPRQPSQLYEFTLEGIVLFTILFLYSRKPRSMGAVSGMFLLWYGIFRFTVEFVRAPDPQLGLVLGPFDMGQVLSFPMIPLGIALILWARRHKSPASSPLQS